MTPDPAPDARPKKRRRAISTWIALSLAASGAVLGTFSVSTLTRPTSSKSRITWDAATGASLRLPFTALLFPVDDEVTGYDAVGTPRRLQRAVVTSDEEWGAAADTIEVIHPDGNFLVSRDRLSFNADSSRRQRLIDALNVEIRAWGPATEWRAARLAPAGSGAGSLRLTMVGQEGDHNFYIYAAQPGGFTPLQTALWRPLHDIGAFLGLFATAALITLALFVLAIGAVVRLHRADRSRSLIAAQ